MRRLIIVTFAIAALVTAGCGGGSHAPAGYSMTDGWITTPSGLKFRDEKVGTGPRASAGSYLTVNYTGWLDDGTVFDSTDRHGKSYSFTLGQGEVIKGWDEGLMGVRAGSITELIIPPDLGYGSQGHGNIPPNSTLHFRIEIVSVS